MRAGYGEKLRSFFIDNTNPVLLFDFTGIKVFNATVDSSVILLQKTR